MESKDQFHGLSICWKFVSDRYAALIKKLLTRHTIIDIHLSFDDASHGTRWDIPTLNKHISVAPSEYYIDIHVNVGTTKDMFRQYLHDLAHHITHNSWLYKDTQYIIATSYLTHFLKYYDFKIIEQKVCTNNMHCVFQLFEQSVQKRNTLHPDKLITKLSGNQKDIDYFLAYFLPSQSLDLVIDSKKYQFTLSMSPDVNRSPRVYFRMRRKYEIDDIKTVYISKTDLISKFWTP